MGKAVSRWRVITEVWVRCRARLREGFANVSVST